MYETVEIACSFLMESTLSESARGILDGTNMFYTPIAWTFPEWFDTSMEYVAQSVEDFFGISGSQ